MKHWEIKQKSIKCLVTIFMPLLANIAKKGNTRVAAAITKACLTRIQKADGRLQRYRVVVLFKVGCTEDVLASLGGDSRFELWGLDRRVIKAFASAFLPPEIDDNNYITEDPSIIRAKDDYRNFLEMLWRKIADSLGDHAVITGNFGYYAERELAAATENIGIPFIVLQKENLRSPGQAVMDEKRNREKRGPFKGRMILQYNNIEREIEINSGVVTPERTLIVGMPRMDRVHKWRIQNAGKPITGKRTVLFFLFGTKSGIPTLPRKYSGEEDLPEEIKKISWAKMQEACINAIIEAARRDPSITFIMKTKGNKSSIALMKKKFAKGADLPANFKIVVGGDPLQLLAQSTVICGFNSTALLEAIAANKPVVVPLLEESSDKKMKPYIIDMGETVNYAFSPNELISSLIETAKSERFVNRGAELTEAQIKVLEKWTGNADGQAGKRVCSALMDILNNSFLKQ